MRTGERTTTQHNPSREEAQDCKLSIHRLDKLCVSLCVRLSVCVYGTCKHFCLGPLWLNIQLEHWVLIIAFLIEIAKQTLSDIHDKTKGKQNSA